MDPLRFVKFFAATKHGNQQYSTGLAYTHHLAAVEAVVRRFKDDILRNYSTEDWSSWLQTFCEAAWLHDVVEDTGTKLKEVEEMFGPHVAILVGAVTNEAGPNRKMRAFATYPKIRATPGAVALKLADRIANVEAGGKLVEMYKKEYEDFRRALHTDGEYDKMWAHLDQLMEFA